jgi:hypothetical protein
MLSFQLLVRSAYKRGLPASLKFTTATSTMPVGASG